MSNKAVRGCMFRTMLAVGAGVMAGLGGAVIADGGGPDPGFGFCVKCDSWVRGDGTIELVCDVKFCGGSGGCTGQTCPNAHKVRACCGSCPEDDWLETCGDEAGS